MDDGGKFGMRLEFSRGSAQKYLSHLDLMRVFERAIRRSGIPIKYSGAFNPHQDMVFGLPLQVGVTADAECLDVGLLCGMNPMEITHALNRQLPSGILIHNAVSKFIKVNVMAQITHAVYSMSVCCDSAVGADEKSSLAARFLPWAVELFLAPGQRVVIKETKKATREFDIAPLVRAIFARDAKIVMTVSAGSKDNVKPDMVLESINNVISGELPAFRKLSLHRQGILIEREGALLSPLDKKITGFSDMSHSEQKHEEIV